MTEQEKKKTVNVEDMQAFGKVIHNKGIGSEGTCTTAAATAAKEVTVGTTFSPVADATLLVTFQNAITVASATLAVTYGPSGSTATLAAKPIYYRGAALGANLVKAGATLLLRYDGTRFNIVGDLDTDTNTVTDVAYDTTNKKLTKTVGGTQSDITTAAQIVNDGGATRPLDIELLPADYVFKPGDSVVMNGALYKCTAQTEATPFTLLAQDGKILYVALNGQKCYMVSSTTLNAGWEKVQDLDDKYYVEDRVKNMLDKATDTNMSVIGFGAGTCDTAAATAAKTVTISGFALKTNGYVAVRFTSAIDATGATLNVNSTGAKTIRMNGDALQPGVVRPGMTAILSYDGTYWNIISLQGLEQSNADGDDWVDLGLPSGLKWAKANLNTRQGGFNDVFSYSPEFFSWGNTEGQKATGSTFDYSFDQTNYNASQGSKLTASIAPSQDAARALLGAPWRLPTKDEFKELFDNCNFVGSDGTTVISASTADKRVTVSGVVGIYLKSKKNGKLIFFPACGYGEGTALTNEGSYGIYATGTYQSSSDCWVMSFTSNATFSQATNYRYLGYCIRPVL